MDLPPVERWCPTCQRIFQATVTVERSGQESTRVESPCPACGTEGDTLLRIPRL